MTPNEIKTLIDQKIAGQGSMVDVGGALPTILKEIVDMASDTPAPQKSALLEITRVPDEDDLYVLTPEETDQILTGQTLSLRIINPTYPIQEREGDYHPRILRTNVDTVDYRIYDALIADMAAELTERGITEFGEMFFFGSITPAKGDDDIYIDSCDLFVVFETGDENESIYKVTMVER